MSKSGPLDGSSPARFRTEKLIGQLLEEFELGWQFDSGWSPELEPSATEPEWLRGIDRQLGTVLRAIQMRRFDVETAGRISRRGTNAGRAKVEGKIKEPHSEK